jgi:hypothetical protein
MYNPFPLITPSLLISQISDKKGKRFFVRQTFKRGFLEGLKAAFLLRGYTEDEKDVANEHFTLLAHDPNAFLYDAKNEEHLEKLKIASRQPSGFKVYYVGKTKVDWKPPKIIVDKLQKYIRARHPHWRTKKGSDPIDAGLYEEFGNIYFKLNFGSEEEKVFFDIIENF